MEDGEQPDLPPEFPKVPAYYVTEACFGYMARRTEHRDHNVLYHELAQRAVKGARQRRKEIYDRYRLLANYYLEGYLCRFHDLVTLYFEDLLYEAAYAKPKLVPTKFAALSKDEAARKWIRGLVAKPLPEVVDYLCTEVVSLPQNSEAIASIKLLSALRNVIVHNDALPDERFLARIDGQQLKHRELPGGRIGIDDVWLMQQPKIVEQLIFELDHVAANELKIETKHRYGRFWMRSEPLPERDG